MNINVRLKRSWNELTRRIGAKLVCPQVPALNGTWMGYSKAEWVEGVEHINNHRAELGLPKLVILWPVL